MEIKEVAGLIELRKRKGTLELKRSLGAECDKELKSVSEALSKGIAKASSEGIDLVLPNQARIEDLESSLKDIPAQDIKEGLKNKSGDAYSFLSERASLFQSSSNNRFEIAKLMILISRMDEVERANLANAIRDGKIGEPLKVGSLKEEERLKLARFLFRCGIPCFLEDAEIKEGEPEQKDMPLRIENRTIWVDEETRKLLEENMRKMEVLGSQLQVRNAKRHVMEFSQEEEDKYAAMQAEYLGLLKQKDKLLESYDAEIVPSKS